MAEKRNDNVIRVCFICFRAYPLFNSAVDAVFGGAEVDLYWIASELAKDPGFAVSMVVGDYGQPIVEQINNVTLIKSIDDDRNLFLQAPKIWRALDQAGADIYFAESLTLGTALDAFYCRQKGKSFVYRTASTEECDGTYFRKRPYRAISARWALKTANPIIVQNRNDAQNLKNTVGLEALVIRNAYPIPESFAKTQETILWIGRSDPIKQPRRFLDLARAMPDEHFTMICSKSLHDSQYDALRLDAEKLGNLTFVPGVPYSGINAWFQRAKVLVNTSVSEGFPNTFVQACLHAVQIVSLNADPDRFLDEYQCGLCAGGDWDRLVEMTRRLLDVATADQWGQNGRQYARKNHDLAEIIPQYKAILKNCMRGSIA